MSNTPKIKQTPELEEKIRNKIIYLAKKAKLNAKDSSSKSKFEDLIKSEDFHVEMES